MGETPLIRAAHNGHFQAVKLLMDSGADVNALDMVRRALLGATGSSQGSACSAVRVFAKLLMDSGADVNALDMVRRALLGAVGSSQG